MSKQYAIELGKVKARFLRLPLPDKFSRIVSVLLGYVNKDKEAAWPSRKLIAQAVGCSEKTVQRNLAAIRQLGLFDIQTIGAAEAQRQLGLKRVSERHLYSLYRPNLVHPLWKGDKDEVQRAIELIKPATWRGIDERCNRMSADSASERTGELAVATTSTLVADLDQFAE